jgi:hypothetical protein
MLWRILHALGFHKWHLLNTDERFEVGIDRECEICGKQQIYLGFVDGLTEWIDLEEYYND